MVDRIARLVVRQAVAALPSRTAVLGRKHPRSGYSDPDSLRVGRVCHHGVKDQPCCSRRPAVRRRMGGQPLDRFPGCPVIAAGQKTCGFGPGIENAAGEGEAPNLRESVAEGQGGRRSSLSSGRNRSRSPPSLSSGPAILGPPDTGAMPVPAVADPDRASLEVTGHTVDGPTFAERAADSPCVALVSTRDQERTLFGSNEYIQTFHCRMAASLQSSLRNIQAVQPACLKRLRYAIGDVPTTRRNAERKVSVDV